MGQRGWCFFEFVVTILFQTCVNLSPKDESTLRELLTSMLGHFGMKADRTHLIEAGVHTILGLCDSSLQTEDELKMDAALDNGDIALLKYSFLKELVKNNGQLQKRQDMPPEAFGAWRNASQIFTIIYCRQGDVRRGQHPDPKCTTLKGIVNRLHSLGVDDTALVYWDWACLYQQPRSEQEEQAFQRGHVAQTSTAGTCSGKRFSCLVLTDPDYSGRPVHEKAWSLSGLFFATFAGNLIFDVPEVLDIIVDKFFNVNLDQKSFTNGKVQNTALVAGLFKSLLYDRAGMSDLDDAKDIKIKELKARIKELEAAAKPC